MAELHAIESRRVFRYVAAIVVGALAIAGNLATLRRSPPRDPAEITLDRLEQFTNQMCQCPDAACARQVGDELTRWAQQLPPAVRDARPDEAVMRRAQAIGDRLANCMMKLMASEEPATEPQPSGTAP